MFQCTGKHFVVILFAHCTLHWMCGILHVLLYFFNPLPSISLTLFLHTFPSLLLWCNQSLRSGSSSDQGNAADSAKTPTQPSHSDIEDVGRRKRPALTPSQPPRVTKHHHSLTPSQGKESWRDVLGEPPSMGSTRVRMCMCQVVCVHHLSGSSLYFSHMFMHICE